MLIVKIKQQDPLKFDLKNGVILDLTFDNKIDAYRGYWKEEDMGVGIWKKETLIEIATGRIDNVKLIEN
jgi:hypothetical protein